VQTLASQIVAFGQINECLAGSIDWEAYAEEQIQSSRRNFHTYLTDPLVDDPRILHVPYRQFVDDPVATIAAFHEHCGTSLCTEAEAAMRDYLAHNRSDRHGRFEYSTDVLPVDVADLDRELAPYRERFGVEIEARG
jgi:hypothetical protein